ncbi:MAG: hypothetical protein KY476_17805 [Planctomycetes bacterium]|nr:hypothetical protein [Planctomycetota bacterium]
MMLTPWLTLLRTRLSPRRGSRAICLRFRAAPPEEDPGERRLAIFGRRVARAYVPRHHWRPRQRLK